MDLLESDLLKREFVNSDEKNTNFLVNSCLTNTNNKIYKKCGEIITYDEKSFWYLCLFCGQEIRTVLHSSDEFFEHLRQIHFQNQIETESENIFIKIESTEEEFKNYEDAPNNETKIDSILTNSILIDNESKEISEIEPTTDLKTKKRILRKSDITSDTDNTCNVCNKNFTEKHSLKLHLRLHAASDNTEVPRCEYCQKNFVSFLYLASHKEKFHKYGNQIKCIYCDELFIESDELIKHVQDNHPPNLRYKCKICFKSFKKKSDLLNHIPIHSDERPFPCELCGFAFKVKADLRKHITRHLGKKKFKCKYCDMCFYNNRFRQDHEFTHTGEKPNICEFCGKAFNRAQGLQNHIKIHENKLEYQCPICEKRFNTNRRLRDHKETHNTEKNYVCTICNGRYKTRKSLDNHRVLHRGEMRHECPVCGKKFMQLAGLHYHKKTHDL